ncbi:SDR family NAD(P)-dependent oxidoreductase [Maritimibacter dapengensis]|uniref:SDR family NAD(P)-dependent oxidoreductase n=1 Tax=Maritimibacter dapengensis TaxID=2836868 RepID=A0ABS6T2G8_9RHOB|nr:SDR family NAD(P)-dependent oxidoreductase [Maritimibacter dapengensis]MBV7379170.1 SDR family NAD(P)-dependent oxidoreductase [Maritimibacter dapengensis]
MQISKDTPVIVTGGASGLGRAVVEALAEAGAPVGIFDLQEDAGEALASELGGAFAKVDVSDPDSVAKGFEAIRAKNGQERIMVNCAGIGTIGKTVSRGEALDPNQFIKTLMVNTAGTFNCASQSALGMTGADPLTDDGERGVIINTASVAAYDGQIGQVSYSASKGAVVGMTLPMARDLSKNGIRVMTIAPGLFFTPMMEGLPEEAQQSLGAQVPFPSRLGKPAEYAAMARHIVENSMLNGEVIRLDGAIRMAPK